MSEVRVGISLYIVWMMLAGCGYSTAEAEHEESVLETQIGDATFYANSFQGDLTASGLKFDNRKPVAAHRTYPFGTVARVTNLKNGKSTSVVIVDRGPYGKNHREGTIIDLSRQAATQLDIIEDGQVRVKVDVIFWGDGNLRD
jgi:rare lipoprotein A